MWIFIPRLKSKISWAVTHPSTNIDFYCLTSLIDIFSHSVTYPLWFDTKYDILSYTYAAYKTSVSRLWDLIETWGFRELHDMKCMTYNMTQNAWQATWRKMCDMLHDTKCVTCYMTQNEWHAMWCKTRDMVHVAKMYDMLHDAKCMTWYMTQNVWHTTWHKICDILHVTQDVWHVTCPKMCGMLHDT